MISTAGSWFKDEHGRTLILRGVNLGGSSKVPRLPDGATHNPESFFEHRAVSFVGRPFPLDEADEHFARLRRWGLTFLRFLVTWEAVEHAGPGQYDEAYLDYLYAVVRKAGEHGLDLFIDPHQDVWSRFSGGDGAPGWTFEAAGLDIPRFAETGAAIVHQTHGDPFPSMIWPTNGSKLAAATMFTLFFGGSDFAPHTQVDGEPVQAYLQRHYLAAMQQVALRLQGLANVVGYGTLNEPLSGYIGCQDLTVPIGQLKMGDMPSPFQSMLLGSGFPQEVAVWKLGLVAPRQNGTRRVNAGQAQAWLPGRRCVWRENGVWDLDHSGRPILLRPDHFTQVNGRAVDFNRDYFLPFADSFTRTIRAVHPGALIFVEAEPEGPLPCWSGPDAESQPSVGGLKASPQIVSAPHWYDPITLMMKTYHAWFAYDQRAKRLVIGPERISRAFARHLGALKAEAVERLAGAPTLIGEFGIPFDLDNRHAYRTGDFRAQVRAMNRSFRALDDNLLSGTLWNYTANNTNAHGDGWNGEDLSIFSRDQQTEPADIHSGGRALPAVVRPYASKTAGEPLRMVFDPQSRIFDYEFRPNPHVTAPTEIFVPDYQYPGGCRVEVSGGTYRIDREAQTLVYHHDPGQKLCRVMIRPAAPG